MSEVDQESRPQFQSLEELMEYVDKEAKRRVEQMSVKYKKMMETDPYDQVILRALREAEEPLSVDLISFLTGISKSRCCKLLKRLEENWHPIRKVTVSRTSYYKAVEGEGGPGRD